MDNVARMLPVFAIVALAACHAPTSVSTPRSLPEFEAHLEQLRQDKNIPGMSAVIADGQHVMWSRGYGFANVAQQIPATDTTAFHLASLTKTFASTIIMQLVEAGQLDLDAPVANFGIALSSPGTIRVRHLLTHTSGGTPGSSFLYDGDRFGLLDQVIQRVTNESFAQRVTDVILTPLRLPHTAPNILNSTAFAFSGLDADAFRKNLAQGYSSDGRMPIPYPNSFGTAAGMVASAIDVASYSMAIDRNAFLRPETQALAFTAAVSTNGQTLPYGLGWFVQTINGVKLQWHYGWWTGNSSLIIRVPERGLVFILLANTDALSAGTRLGFGDLLSSPAARAFLDAFVFR